MACGLTSVDNKQVPLKRVDVFINIAGAVAQVKSTLAYENDEDTPIEAVFTFPVDDESAVYHFEAEIEDRKIVAEIQEKEKARQTYTDSVKSGKTAALLEQDDKSADIFRCMLGRLPARSEAKLTMSYAEELSADPDGRLQFTLPTVLNPRYTPATSMRDTSNHPPGIERTDCNVPRVSTSAPSSTASNVSPNRMPYTFSVTVHVHNHNEVISVTSPGCKLNTEVDEDSNSAKITLAEEYKFDHDLSFLVEYKNKFEPRIILEKGNHKADGLMKEDLVMMTFNPKFETTTSTRDSEGEFVFVIDRSGSMGGEKIKNASDALLLFLKSLPIKCHFNVISFGSSFQSLFPKSDKYGETTLKQAERLQQSITANMGGTEILSPLKHLLQQSPVGTPRNVFVLTDGDVGNTDDVIGLIRAHASTSRVFSLGIGHGASTALVKGIARAGNGKAEFISDGRNIQKTVVSLLKCATESVCENLTIDWELPPGVIPLQIPLQLPSFVTSGERLTIFAMLQNTPASKLEGCLTLKGNIRDTQILHKLPFAKEEGESSTSPRSQAHILAVKRQIKILEDEHDDHRTENSKRKDLKEKIISLSRHANLVSRFTSFVAVDDRGSEVSAPFFRPIGLLCNSSSGMSRSSGPPRCLFLPAMNMPAPSSPPWAMPMAAPPSPPRDLWAIDLAAPSPPPRVPRAMPMAVSCEEETYEDPDVGAILPPPRILAAPMPFLCMAAPPTTVSANVTVKTFFPKRSMEQEKVDPMMRVISAQSWEGFWESSTTLEETMQVSKSQILSVVHHTNENVAYTVAVIAWLKMRFPDKQGEWQMVVEKAERWLKTQLGEKDSLQELYEKCEEHIFKV